MFRKILLATVASIGLMSAFALPTTSVDAAPRYVRSGRAHVHYRGYTHRDYRYWGYRR